MQSHKVPPYSVWAAYKNFAVFVQPNLNASKKPSSCQSTNKWNAAELKFYFVNYQQLWSLPLTWSRIPNLHSGCCYFEVLGVTRLFQHFFSSLPWIFLCMCVFVIIHLWKLKPMNNESLIWPSIWLKIFLLLLWKLNH